jgi:hypothetical protein
MFNVSYEYAKQEVARRHERLVEAQRSGTAFESRPRKASYLARLGTWFRSPEVERAESPAGAQGEPCATC